MSTQSPAVKSAAMKVSDFYAANKKKLEATIPKHVNPDRLMRVAVQAISASPILAQCSFPSLITSILRASMLGLEPNGPLGEAYLVPFKNHGVYECQLIPGYRGLINIARRSGEVTEVYSYCVYENDVFDIELGTSPKLTHKPNVNADRGKMIGVYGVYVTRDGSKDFEYMSKAEVDAIRGRSKSGNNGPWNTDYDEMARKTVIRRLSKRMPMSVEMAQVVDIDNRTAVGEVVDHSEVLDIAGIEIPEDAPMAQVDQNARLEGAMGQ